MADATEVTPQPQAQPQAAQPQDEYSTPLPQGAKVAAPSAAAPAQAGPQSEDYGTPLPQGATVQGMPQVGSISAAPKPANAGALIKQWATNVSNDIKYGTDTTGVGTLLKKMGAHGVYMGNAQAVGDFMASLPLGLLKAGGGIADMHNNPGQDLKDVGSGLLQASIMPGAFIAPEAAELGADTAGAASSAVQEGASSALNTAKNTVGRVKAAYTEPLQADREAIEASAMRHVQPTIKSDIRSIMNDVEKESGIEAPKGGAKPAGQGEPSIRKAVEQTADRFYTRAKATYKELDEATGGQFQRFDNQLRDVNRQLKELISTDTEESVAAEKTLMDKKSAIEDAQEAAFDKAKASGVDPNLIEGARQDFKKSQALYDLDYAVKKSTNGARPDNPSMFPEDYVKNPEVVHPRKLADRLDALYDSGRLQEAVGEERANKMLADASDNLVAHKQELRAQSAAAAKRIRSNARIRTGVNLGAAGLATAWGLPSLMTKATHVFVPGQGVSPVQ